MSGTFLFANNASTVLAGPIAANATGLSVAAASGGLFPNPSPGQQFSVTIRSQANPLTVREIAYCTSRTGDSFTIIRGQEGTTATSFVSGDFVDNFLTAGALSSLVQSTQLQQQSGNYAVDTGTINNVVINRTPTPVTIGTTVGEPIRIKIANTNVGLTTLTDSGLPTTVILNPDGSPTQYGQLVAGGIATVVFDGLVYQLTDTVPGYHPGFANIQTFLASGSWVAPTGVFSVKARLWGGGGAGGNSNGVNVAFAGAGGGAGYVEGYVSVTPGNNYVVTVGASGVAGTTITSSGGAGGTSTFNGMSANGGSGGTAQGGSGAGRGGAGGTGSGGNPGSFIYTGGIGGEGYAVTSGAGITVITAVGGSSFASNFSSPAIGGGSANGGSGIFPGGGGGGGAGGGVGGSGAHGMVIIEW